MTVALPDGRAAGSPSGLTPCPERAVMTPASGAYAAILATLALTLGVASPAGPAHAGSAAITVAPAAANRAADAAGATSAAGYVGPDIPATLPAAARTAGSGTGPASSAAAGTPATSNITSAGSLNWSGYAVSHVKSTFRLVRATFFVPYLDCAQSPGATMSSDWAGLDGYVGHPDSVEQAGIAADCSATGHASYFGWLEMFPYAQVRLAIRIHAGDSVTVQVSYNPATRKFRLTLTDTTRGERVSKLRKCPDVKVSGKAVTCPRNSAEVISEAPESGSGSQLVIEPLSDYGAVSYANISITDSAGKSGGIVSSHWSATRIVQLAASGGAVVAEPTSVAAGMFDSYWQRES